MGQPTRAGWAVLTLTVVAGCGGSPANPWKPGEVDLAHVDGLCFANVTTAPGTPTPTDAYPPPVRTYGDDCTYVGRDANGDSVPSAFVQWKVEAGIVPLTTTALDPLGRVRIRFTSPAAPGDSAQLWMCASTLPPPCTLIDYGGTVRFLGP